jgi:hypothetical protein
MFAILPTTTSSANSNQPITNSDQQFASNNGDDFVIKPSLLFVAAAVTVIGCGKASDSAPAKKDTVTVATTPPATPPPAAHPVDTGSSGAQSPAGSDVTGAYFAIGNLPAEFSEIDYLALATIDENAKPAPLNGFIRPKVLKSEDYHLVDPKLAGKNLSFTTKSVNGVSYSFTGVFDTLGNFPENPPEYEKPVLKGKLVKMKDGKMVAETDVNYSYSAGG